MPLILSTNRIVQPVGAVGINQRNPLTRGLVSLICPGCGLRDLVSGRVGASAGIRHALTSKGKSWSLDGTASTVIDMGGMPPNLPDLSGTYTLAAIVIPDGTSAVGPVIRLFDGTRNIQIGYIVNNGWMGMQSTVSNSSRAISVSSAYGKFHTFIGSHANGADIDTLVNGEILGKAGAAGPSLTTAGYYLNNPDITATTARVLLVAIWNRFLTVGEKRAFTRNPWDLFESAGLWIDQPTEASAGLAGSATGQASASGSLTTGIPLSGAAVVQVTGSGSLTTQIPLSGSAASVSVASGVLTTTLQLSGAALAQAGATGALTTQIRLSGAAVMQALASAGLTTAPQGLSGGAIASATATGTLTTGIPIAGNATAFVTGAGGLTTAIRLSGAAVAVCNATGDLIVSGGLSAAAVAQVIATGTLSTQIRLSAAAVLSALAIAVLMSDSGIGWIADPRYRASGFTRSYRACLP
ncbi:MAG: hypothetical protein ABTS16_21155 [Candidatus Accumulibacter phosphatis]|uniref:Uncharacterized protein n=1 Tax=Candidatus Accumulibacter contiguus TaxID=2954381 RepID=A0ABX1T9T3_9PROT|nr:hypothetical protein [Candidatus Accumulibacter contiguus]NMQ05261.1 hypothetical protein [Candidatus Accumulibacter contiguus]